MILFQKNMVHEVSILECGMYSNVSDSTKSCNLRLMKIVVQCIRANFYGFYLQQSVCRLFFITALLLKKYVIIIILLGDRVSSFMFCPAEQVIKLVSPFELLLNWDSLHARLNSRYKVWIYNKK